MKCRPSFVFMFSCVALGVALFGQSASAEQIAWQTNFQQAAKQAQQQKKPLLIKVGASWCHYCVKMKRETFQDAHIADHVNACFVPVSLDADRNRDLVRALNVRAFPTTLVVSPEMKIIKRISGYQSVRQFDTHLEHVCQRH
jgi:uncharacterized protein YyaL (SSP411 family)